jgi:hypothetical protein
MNKIQLFMILNKHERIIVRGEGDEGAKDPGPALKKKPSVL